MNVVWVGLGGWEGWLLMCMWLVVIVKVFLSVL